MGFVTFQINGQQAQPAQQASQHPPKSGLNKLLGTFSTSTSKMLAVGSLVMGGAAIAKAVKEVKNDVRRKRLITELHTTDPVLSELPPEQILEWYATIYNFAPHFSLDKSAVKEVLQNFARFGRVDVNTLKMLADTEKSTQQAAAASKSWGDIFTNLGKAVSLGS